MPGWPATSRFASSWPFIPGITADRERFIRIGGLDDLVALLLEHCADERPNDGLVLDQEDRLEAARRRLQRRAIADPRGPHPRFG
jgi:hypothetical protein